MKVAELKEKFKKEHLPHLSSGYLAALKQFWEDAKECEDYDEFIKEQEEFMEKYIFPGNFEEKYIPKHIGDE